MSKKVTEALLNSDYTKEGYDLGLEQAKTGSAKNRFTALKEINPVNYLVHTNNSLKTVWNGQDKGYVDGKRVENEVFKTQLSGGDVEVYENHLRMLSDVKRQLVAMKKQLEVTKESYLKQINAAQAAGFMENYIDPLRERYEVFSSKIEHLDNVIKRHESVISDHEAKLHRLIEVAKMQP